jgi:hypothetical protein
MKKVTAYESNNGRLFHTEAECLKYEAKMSQYPKVKHTDEIATEVTFDGKTIEHPIVKCTEIIWKTPNKRRTKKWYIVNGKYKVQFREDYVENFWMKNITATHSFVYPIINALINVEDPFSNDAVENMSKQYGELQYNTSVHWAELGSRSYPKDYVAPYIIQIEECEPNKYNFINRHQVNGTHYEALDKLSVEKID